MVQLSKWAVGKKKNTSWVKNGVITAMAFVGQKSSTVDPSIHITFRGKRERERERERENIR